MAAQPQASYRVSGGKESSALQPWQFVPFSDCQATEVTESRRLLDMILTLAYLYLVNRGCTSMSLVCTRRAPESHKNHSVNQMRQFVDTCD